MADEDVEMETSEDKQQQSDSDKKIANPPKKDRDTLTFEGKYKLESRCGLIYGMIQQHLMYFHDRRS